MNHSTYLTIKQIQTPSSFGGVLTHYNIIHENTAEPFIRRIADKETAVVCANALQRTGIDLDFYFLEELTRKEQKKILKIAEKYGGEVVGYFLPEKINSTQKERPQLTQLRS